VKRVFVGKRGRKVRGVNLGGWLVLEKWMTPSLFAGLKAEDETAWCIEQGDEAERILKQHWNTFIGRDDFAWLAAIGINSVRIPVGHWLFGPDYPYHRSYGDVRYPFVSGGVAVLDRAFDWAEELGLLVVLDLHAAPGCQNGFDNGGIKDVCEWHTEQEYIDHSLTVLERLAERYHGRPALHAIEVLNEPRWDIPTELLARYTADAYGKIRKYCRAEEVAVVFHDGFRSYREYVGVLQGSEYDNMVFDIHRYQCFVQEDKDTDVYGHIKKSAIDWKNEADEIIQNSGRWTYVGEWSLGLDPKMMAMWEQQAFDHDQPRMDVFQQDIAYRAYAAAQLASFEKYLGWFFWSYKTETMPHWSFRDCVEHGWLPDRYA